MTLSLSEVLEQIGERAASASRILSQATTAKKNEALLAIARRIEEEAPAILAPFIARTWIGVALSAVAVSFAVAAITNGHARGLGLRALLGAQEAHDERASDVVAGCCN